MGDLYQRDMASSCLSLGILALFSNFIGRYCSCKMRPWDCVDHLSLLCRRLMLS